MIEVRDVTKAYGPTVAVDRLTFDVRPGHVTGFLGPNGSGKSTTMRVVLGLDAPTSGEALVGGQRYVDLRAPLREVGAMLDARAVHPGRTARDHLRVLALSNRIPARRVAAVLEQVGLTDVADRRAGGYSLGMAQRLGVAAALLGDPAALLLDEPVNGLDTEGIRWIRGLLKGLAAEGRTVLLSSHLMSEVELTADRVVVIGAGRLLAETTVEELVASGPGAGTYVRTPDAEALRAAVARRGGDVELDPTGGWRIRGVAPPDVGELARDRGIALHELRPIRSSLEDVYSELTAGAVRYHGGAQAAARPEEVPA